MTTTSLLAAAAPATPGAGQFLGVDWSSILLVLIVTAIATVGIVTIFSLGLRLLATGLPDDVDEVPTDVGTATRPMGATVGGVVCVGIGCLAVLYGIYLVIPLFPK